MKSKATSVLGTVTVILAISSLSLLQQLSLHDCDEQRARIPPPAVPGGDSLQTPGFMFVSTEHTGKTRGR